MGIDHGEYCDCGATDCDAIVRSTATNREDDFDDKMERANDLIKAAENNLNRISFLKKSYIVALVVNVILMAWLIYRNISFEG
jgi:hypothetical protein